MKENEINLPKDDDLQAHNSEVVNSRFTDETERADKLKPDGSAESAGSPAADVSPSEKENTEQ